MKTPRNLLKGIALQSSRQHRPSMTSAPMTAAGATPARDVLQTLATVPAAGPALRTAASAIDRAELRRVQEAARQEGLAIGLKQAKAEADKLQREHAERLRQLMDSLAKYAEEHRARIESRLADFAFATVTRMLGEAALAPEARIACVRAALKACEPWHEVTIELNAADVALVAQALAEGGAGSAMPKIVASPAVRAGGCRVIQGDDTLDARFETQLELLHAALAAACVR